MNRRERGEAVLRILREGDFSELAKFEGGSRWLLRRLAAFLQSPDPRIRWRAVLALGFAARNLQLEDQSPREIARSLLWSMNDESGNLCRMAPEALGELCAARPDMAAEFGGLLPQFLVEEPFETGTLWGLCRLADAGYLPDLGRGECLAPSLAHGGDRRRGLARRLAFLCGIPLAR